MSKAFSFIKKEIRETLPALTALLCFPILARVEAAKAELAAVRLKGLKPLRDCAAEAAAMAQ